MPSVPGSTRSSRRLVRLDEVGQLPRVAGHDRSVAGRDERVPHVPQRLIPCGGHGALNVESSGNRGVKGVDKKAGGQRRQLVKWVRRTSFSRTELPRAAHRIRTINSGARLWAEAVTAHEQNTAVADDEPNGNLTRRVRRC